MLMHHPLYHPSMLKPPKAGPFTTNDPLDPLFLACMSDNTDIIKYLIPHCTQNTLISAISRDGSMQRNVLQTIRLVFPHIQYWSTHSFDAQSNLYRIVELTEHSKDKDKIWAILFENLNPLWLIEHRDKPNPLYLPHIKRKDFLWSICTKKHIDEFPKAYETLTTFLADPKVLPNAPIFKAHASKENLVQSLPEITPNPPSTPARKI